jgi:hypothetical protein
MRNDKEHASYNNNDVGRPYRKKIKIVHNNMKEVEKIENPPFENCHKRQWSLA